MSNKSQQLLGKTRLEVCLARIEVRGDVIDFSKGFFSFYFYFSKDESLLENIGNLLVYRCFSCNLSNGSVVSFARNAGVVSFQLRPH